MSQCLLVLGYSLDELGHESLLLRLAYILRRRAGIVRVLLHQRLVTADVVLIAGVVDDVDRIDAVCVEILAHGLQQPRQCTWSFPGNDGSGRPVAFPGGVVSGGRFGEDGAEIPGTDQQPVPKRRFQGAPQLVGLGLQARMLAGDLIDVLVEGFELRAQRQQLECLWRHGGLLAGAGIAHHNALIRQPVGLALIEGHQVPGWVEPPGDLPAGCVDGTLDIAHGLGCSSSAQKTRLVPRPECNFTASRRDVQVFWRARGRPIGRDSQLAI